MDKAVAAAIKITISTPGWIHLVRMVESRVEETKLSSLINTDESKVLELWRRAQVADQLFFSFLQDAETASSTDTE
jgi:hypothetical protein